MNRMEGSLRMVIFGIGCLSVSVVASGQVMFTTVPPVSYEPVGIVSTLQRLPMAIIDPTKPFKDAIRLSYEDLGKQAQVKAADTVVITTIVPILGREEGWLLIYGTAVRTKRGPGASTAIGEATGSATAGSPPTTAASPDLSGTWTGELKEVDGDDTYPVEVNLGPGPNPGEYAGGLTDNNSGCSVTLAFHSKQDEWIILVAQNPTKIRCFKFGGPHSIRPLPDGKLEWHVFSTKKEEKFSGVLSRRL